MSEALDMTSSWLTSDKVGTKSNWWSESSQESQRKVKRHTTHWNQRSERVSPSRGKVYNKVYNNL